MYASWLHTENQKSRLTFAKQTDRYIQRDMHANSTRFSLTKYFTVWFLLLLERVWRVKTREPDQRWREREGVGRERGKLKASDQWYAKEKWFSPRCTSTHTLRKHTHTLTHIHMASIFIP